MKPSKKLRVMGIDPGLTRCGVGIVEASSPGKLTLIGAGVIRTDSAAPLAARLMALEGELERAITEFAPDVIAVERVFSQANVRTAMSTGQAAGVALLLAAKNSIPVAMHTPSEVKAAVSGNGRADKAQVAAMVVAILSLKSAPKPVDVTDALALAICNHWRGTGNERLIAAVRKTGNLGRAKTISGGERRIKS